MKKYSILLLLSVFSVVQTYALHAHDVLKKIKENYEGMNTFEMQINYKLYKGISGFDLKEEYNSVYKKDNQDSYRRLGNFEFVNTASYTLVIDHEQHQMTLSDPQQVTVPDHDYKRSLKQCSSIIVTKENKEMLTLKLVIKEKSDLPFAAITVMLDNDCWIKSLVFFYNEQMDFSSSYFSPEKDYARMEISYGKIKNKWSDEENLTALETYLTVENHVLNPALPFKNYTLYDYRSTTKN